MKKLSIITLTIVTGLYAFNANALMHHQGYCSTQRSCAEALSEDCASIVNDGNSGHLTGTVSYKMGTDGCCLSCEATCEAGGATFKVKKENSGTKEIIKSKIRTPSKTVTAREIK